MNMKKKQIIVIGAVVLVLIAIAASFFIIRGIRTKEANNDDLAFIGAEVDQKQNGNVSNREPEDIWTEDESEGYNGFTTKQQLGVKEGSIGLLSIPKISVECPVFDSENTMEDMKKGAVHFMSTSYWDGNVALSAHIGKLDYCYFDRLKELREGDKLSYETTFGTRNYIVQTITVISDDDWDMMARCDDNRLTLITCIAGKESQRLCVQAVEA